MLLSQLSPDQCVRSRFLRACFSDYSAQGKAVRASVDPLEQKFGRDCPALWKGRVKLFLIGNRNQSRHLAPLEAHGIYSTG